MTWTKSGNFPHSVLFIAAQAELAWHKFASGKTVPDLDRVVSRKVRNMEPKECFCRNRFGYCWLEGDQWWFQAVDAQGATLDEPCRVELDELVFHHDRDEELH